MADVELTEMQTRIYEVILEVESISKKKLASKMDVQLRSISSPVKALLDRGVLVTDEYGDLSIAAGVREEFDEGYVTVPASPEVPPDPQVVHDDVAAVEETEDSDLFSDYWQLHPEELVTFHGEEGLDALKRASLVSAMKSAVGVGQKALDAALHWYDIDDDVRRDPTALMRALEDAGVKHNLVGRIARETFLPEKQYGTYIQGEEMYVHPGRTPSRKRPSPRNQKGDVDEFDDVDDDDYYENRVTSRRRSRSRDDDMPWWAQKLVQRIDAIDGGTSDRGRSESPQVVIEPVLDEYGNPIRDPNTPGKYLERRVVYDQPGGAPSESVVVSELRDQLTENNMAIAKMREALAEHETERKISSAVDPLMAKITGLERRDPTVKAGMTDEQFKLQTEKEIFQDMSSSVENTISNLVEPVLEGITEVQRMQSMREIIELERQDKVPPGTYLKYMTGGDAGGDVITKNRVGNTIDMIKSKSGAR